MNLELIYLASPYTAPSAELREWRYHQAVKAAAKFIGMGFHIFAPIAYSHPLVEHGLKAEWDFWQEFDRHFLYVCKEMWILTLPGWRDSVGINAEIGIMTYLERPIRIAPWLDTDVIRLPEVYEPKEG